MEKRFRGESTQKVDGKGRVSIPSLFRRVIEACDPAWSEGKAPNLVIVYGLDNQRYLEGFTIEAAQRYDAKIDRMKRGPKKDLLQTIFNGHSVPTSVDDTGRIVLPAKLRTKIGLKDEAYFIATGETFKIWKPETYAEVELPKKRALLESLPEDFDPLDLIDEEDE